MGRHAEATERRWTSGADEAIPGGVVGIRPRVETRNIPMAQLRHLGPGFDPAVVAGIDAKLHEVEASNGVRILLAIESGSRGWGFPSPDSDYDCRFIHVRPQEDYLSLYPPRDVIEYPPDAIYDVNGWDLVKALKLLLKGNAVVLEWLMSPFVYAGDADFRAEALVLAGQVVQPAAIAMHYLHLGERQRETAFADGSEVRLKKLFYVLRPALALRWMRLHPDKAIVPMAFRTLVAESDVSADCAAIIDDLLARKAETREMGRGAMPREIGALIDAEFGLARGHWPEPATRPQPEAVRLADAFFRRWVVGT
jgi:hypothetical protein